MGRGLLIRVLRDHSQVYILNRRKATRLLCVIARLVVVSCLRVVDVPTGLVQHHVHVHQLSRIFALRRMLRRRKRETDRHKPISSSSEHCARFFRILRARTLGIFDRFVVCVFCARIAQIWTVFFSV